MRTDSMPTSAMRSRAFSSISWPAATITSRLRGSRRRPARCGREAGLQRNELFVAFQDRLDLDAVQGVAVLLVMITSCDTSTSLRVR
jgi:hypothetical protein